MGLQMDEPLTGHIYMEHIWRQTIILADGNLVAVSSGSLDQEVVSNPKGTVNKLSQK